MRDIWDSEDWKDIWRIEFQMRRVYIKKFGIESIDDLKACAGALWRYLTEEWLSLRLPDSTNTSRRTVHLYWQAVQGCADSVLGPELELQRRASMDGLGTEEWHASHISGCLASFAALIGEPDRMAATKRLLDAVDEYWEGRGWELGIQQEGDPCRAVGRRSGRCAMSRSDPQQAGTNAVRVA
jgi:hypothetical protein